MKKILFFSLVALFAISCEPVEVADINLGTPPAAPEFTVDFLDGNTVVVTDLSSGNFTRIWDFGMNANGDAPLKRTSSDQVDTINYPKQGDYTITLHVSATSGGGTSQSSETINIAQDGTVSCDPVIALLTGDCLPAGKCWTLSQDAGSIKAGPGQGDYSWFTSNANSLAPAQADDSFCFKIDNTSFTYSNSGQTIDPWNGYNPVGYTPPTDHIWSYSPGTGTGGNDQIILSEGSFLGVWDASNVYDIISITANQMIVQSPIINQDGTPQAQGGWFELIFIAQ